LLDCRGESSTKAGPALALAYRAGDFILIVVHGTIATRLWGLCVGVMLLCSCLICQWLGEHVYVCGAVALSLYCGRSVLLLFSLMCCTGIGLFLCVRSVDVGILVDFVALFK
jgi:hypothetical protein